MNKEKKHKRLKLSDWLVLLSFLIVVITTALLNIYVALYILAAVMFLLSYLISKREKR